MPEEAALSARARAQVFFLDSLKFFLSLYGHKLPVLSMDISSDGALLVSSSADKNIKIWGLDFGDCHKSLFAHQDSIMQARPPALPGLAHAGQRQRGCGLCCNAERAMYALKASVSQAWILWPAPTWARRPGQVAFVPGTHYVFTAGKDRLVKFWDADRWELLLTLEGHHAEARRMHACRACRHPLPRAHRP